MGIRTALPASYLDFAEVILPAFLTRHSIYYVGVVIMRPFVQRLVQLVQL